MKTLEDYLRDHNVIDFAVHITQRADGKPTIGTISPSGQTGDPFEFHIATKTETKKD